MLAYITKRIFREQEIHMSDIGKYVMFDEKYGIAMDIKDPDKFSIIRRFIPSNSDQSIPINVLTSEKMYNSISGSKFPKIENKEEVKFTFGKKFRTSVFKVNIKGSEIEIVIKGSDVVHIKHKHSIYRCR